jgi:hypothetical protein
MSGQQLIDLLNEAKHATRYDPGPRQRALLDELQNRLESVDLVMQRATVGTMGLLAAARGELSAARALLESQWWLPRAALEGTELEHGFHWLLVDAAAEGKWKRVDWLVSQAGRDVLVAHSSSWAVQRVLLVPRTPQVSFFRELAWRVVRSGASPGIDSDTRVRLPHAALAFERTFSGVAPPVPASQALVTDDGPLAELYRSALALAARPPDKRLAKVAELVESELSSRGLRDELFERATLVGGADPDEAVAEVRELLEHELGTRISSARYLEHPLLVRAAASERRTALDACEARLGQVVAQLEEDRAPPTTELWREFVAIRALYARAVDLSVPGERGWPHQVLVRHFRYVGTWLRLNGEPFFARAIFDFLMVEAHRAGDEAARQLAINAAELCATG